MSLQHAVRAERLKVRRSAASRLPWAGLAIALLQGTLFLISPQALNTWRGLTAWQSLWVTFLLPLFLALLTGLTSVRESRSMGGGLWWRALSWDRQGQAEWLWLTLLSLLMNAAVVLPTLPLGALARVPGEWPWARLGQLTLLLTLTSLPLLALGQRISRQFGLVAGLIVAFLGNFSGLLLAEGPLWYLSPWAWPIRATLTLTGTAANGVPLDAGNPLWQVSPWPVVGVALTCTGVLVMLPYALPRATTHRRIRRSGPLRPWRWSGPLAAERVKFRHTSLPWLVVVMPLLLALLALLRLNATTVWEVWSLLLLPFAVALLPAISWGWETEHWRILNLRGVSPARLYTVKLLALWLAALLSGGMLCVLMAWLGKPLEPVVLRFSLFALTCFALLSFHLWLAVRFSPAVTLGAGIVTTLLAAILGSTGLGAGIWPFFPWIWVQVLPLTEGVPLWPYLVALPVLGLVWLQLGARAATERP